VIPGIGVVAWVLMLVVHQWLFGVAPAVW